MDNNELTMDKLLKFHSGDGFGSCKEFGDFIIKYGTNHPKEKKFKRFEAAKAFYDSLKEEKAFWDGMELIECMT